MLTAAIVLIRGRANELKSFNRLSVIVWPVCLLPFIAGAIASMSR